MSRQVPWRRNCPDVVSRRIEEANQARIYLLRETGPTGFLLKEDGGDKKFKVFLGDLHSCTCNTFTKEKELCIHILWVLVKKFRVPKENDIVFQLSLVEREINEVIRGTYVRHQQHDKKNHNTSSEKKEKLKQKEITEEDVCPICQDDLLTKSGEPLTYCKFGCGNSIHLKCMKVWAEHQRSTGEKIMKCPLCRVDFGTFQDLVDEFNKSSKMKTRAERQDLHLGAMCHKCRVCPIAGKCYRCVICVDFHLCHACFVTDHHMQHSFQFRQNSSQRWRPASRITPLPNAVIDQLQNRDITEDDYDLLLQLDRPLEEQDGIAGHVLSSISVEILRQQHPLLTQNKNCGICLHRYQPFQCIRKLQCNHIFHRDCIDSWLSNHSTCPVDGMSVMSTNEWSQSLDVSPPVIGRDKNNKVLTQRQRLLARRREGASLKLNQNNQKSLPSTFSLSGLAILTNNHGESTLQNETVCNSSDIIENNPTDKRQHKEHIFFEPTVISHKPPKPLSPIRAQRSSPGSLRSGNLNKRSNLLPSRQHSASLENLTLNISGLVMSEKGVRHGVARKGHLLKQKLSHNVSRSDPDIYAGDEPLLASGIAISLPSQNNY